jgi:hypothetical protein
LGKVTASTWSRRCGGRCWSRSTCPTRPLNIRIASGE